MESTAPPRRDERGYWLLRTSNKRDIYTGLLTFVPSSDPERQAWLRGMFDSEGNTQLLHQPKVSPAAFKRRVAFYNTDPEIVENLTIHLEALDFKTIRYIQKPGRNHFGTKPVIEIRLSNSREAFSRFAIEIGSSIARKQIVLDAIPGSYQPPGHHARAGRKGVATRKARQLAGGRY